MGVVYFSIIPTFEPSRYYKCWIVCFYNIYHLTGMSMQMLTFLLQKDNSYMEEENLCREALAKAKEQTLYLNDVLKGEKKN